jgi:hypothetical protein
MEAEAQQGKTMKAAIKYTLAATAVAILAACGGGGGSTPTAGTAEGFWSGTTNTGYDVALAVLENGETWGIYISNSGLEGALYGTSTGSGNTFSASGSNFNLRAWSVTGGTLTGTVVQRSTINAVSNGGGTLSLTYDASYDTPATLTAVAGNYTVSGISASGSANNVPMTITSGGLVTVTGTGCSASGTVAPRSSGKNIYNISMTFTGINCALGNGGTASGIFVLDRSVTPNIALSLALTPSKQDGFIAVGEKN